MSAFPSHKGKKAPFFAHFFSFTFFWTNKANTPTPDGRILLLLRERDDDDDEDDFGERRRDRFGEVFGEDASSREEEAKERRGQRKRQ